MSEGAAQRAEMTSSIRTVPTDAARSGNPIHDLLTVDVWDTLLRRRCHPDCVKLHVCRLLLLQHGPEIPSDRRDPWSLLRLRQQAEKELGEACRRNGLDDEYRHREVYARWLELAGYPPAANGGAIDGVVDFLEQAEISQERFVSYADPSIASTLATYSARQTLFLSDFYLPASVIRDLLTLHELEGLAGDGVVSCEVGLNKRSGRLYEHLHRELGVSPDRHLHIGDNLHSDVAAARELGIASVHFPGEMEHARRLQLDAGFNARDKFLRDAVRNEFGQTPPDMPLEQCIHDYGMHCSPLLIGFVLHIMEQAATQQAERVFFFTREGEFFQQIYRRLASLDVLGLAVPPAQLLQVSRLATFAASLHEFSAQALMRIWTQYSTQSLHALLVSLGVDPSDYTEAARCQAIDPATPIQYPWQDERMLGFLHDPAVLSRIEPALRQKRDALIAYLKSAGFPTNSGTAFVVDIGWRGTIQDNLAYALPGVNISGIYLGLSRYLNPQPANAGKIAYGPDLNRGTELGGLLDFVAPIEMLCNSPGGSVLQHRGDGEQIETVRQVDPDENAVFCACSRHFQQGVLDSIPFWADFLRTHAYTASDLRPLALERWQEIIDHPPAFLARAYFQLKHNETFGLGGFDDKRSIPTIGDLLFGFVSARRRDIVNRFLQRMGWIPGLLARPDLDPVFRHVLRLYLWGRVAKQRMARSTGGS